MTPKGISLNMLFAAVISFTFSSCGKKAQIEYETAQARQSMNELQVVAKRADAEVMATGNLGPYQQTTPGMITDLKRKIEEAQQTIESLKAERDAAREKTEALQAETAAYRSKYRSL